MAITLRRLTLVAAAAALLPSSSLLADRYYVGPSGGLWSNSAGWSLTSGGAGGAGVPPAGQTIWVKSPGTTVNLDVDYSAAGLNVINVDGDSATGITQPTVSLKANGIVIAHGTYTQGTGTNTTNVSIGNGVGQSGTYILNGGTLNETDNDVNIGTGAFIQNSGDHLLASGFSPNLNLATDPGSHASYEIKAGKLVAATTLVGYHGTAAFVQSGGTVTLSAQVGLGHDPTGVGTYDLSGTGILNGGYEYIATYGKATFTQSGGTNNATYLYVAYDPSSSGTYLMQGGALKVTAGFYDGGLFRQSGGTVTAGRMDVNANSTYEYSGGSLIASIKNSGVCTFSADFSVTVAKSWTATAGAVFNVAHNLTVASTDGAAWDTTLASLVFTGDVDGHCTFALPGRDLGAVASGYSQNFAWQRVQVNSGVSLTLSDGNAQPGGALYVRELLLADGTSQIGSLAGNGASIYYDPAAIGNSYLNGQTYPLTGGGVLAPIVPEPALTAMFVLSGIVPIALRRRQR